MANQLVFVFRITTDSISVTTGAGDDTIAIDSNGTGTAGGTVDNIKSSVTAVAGGGADALTLEDSSDSTSDTIDIKWGSDDDKNIALPDAQTRDELAAALSERLDGFSSKTVEFSRPRAALLPMSWGGGLAFFTWVFHQAALQMQAGQEAEIEGRHRAIKQLVASAIDLIGPAGVLVTGGVMISLTAFWLVKRVGDPPIMTTLEPGRRTR